MILLHGGLGHSGNWGYQVPALVTSGYRAVVIHSRSHGRSTRDARPYTYELMASDVVAVMHVLQIQEAGRVGWSEFIRQEAKRASYQCVDVSDDFHSRLREAEVMLITWAPLLIGHCELQTVGRIIHHGGEVGEKTVQKEMKPHGHEKYTLSTPPGRK